MRSGEGPGQKRWVDGWVVKVVGGGGGGGG